MKLTEKTKYIIFSAIISVIMLLLVIIAVVFNPNFKDFLTENIVPELIGICVELLVIIWVFETWQRKKQHKKILFMKNV